MAATATFFNQTRFRDYLRTLVKSRQRTVFALEFNHGATHLAAGNSEGHLNIFDLRTAARDFSSFRVAEKLSMSTPRLASPYFSVETELGPIYGLFSNGDVLFCGTDSCIRIYRWTDLLDKNTSTCSSVNLSSIEVSRRAMTDEPIETNAITGRKGGTRVFAATGCGSVHCFAADSLRCLNRYEGGGPRGYPHCICMGKELDENIFVTGGDDGIARMYDVRVDHYVVKSFDVRKLTGRSRGGWIGCIATDTDGTVLACGAGNRTLTTIHIGSGAVLGTTSLAFVPNAIVYRNGELYCGGADMIHSAPTSSSTSHDLQRYSLECMSIGKAAFSSSGVYAITLHPESKSMAASGYSTCHQWHDAAELIDVYVKPPVRSFCMAASGLAMSKYQDSRRFLQSAAAHDVAL